MSKLIAIITNKATGERFEAREAIKGLSGMAFCGPDGEHPCACCFFNDKRCEIPTLSLCFGPQPVYFAKVQK